MSEFEQVPYILTFRERAQDLIDALQVSSVFLYHVFVFRTLHWAVGVLHLAPILSLLCSKLEQFLSAFFVGLYKPAKGEPLPYSLINVMTPDFILHPSYAEVLNDQFPWKVPTKMTPYEHPWNTHFLSLLSRATYERPALIRDLVINRWKLEGFQSIAAMGTMAFVVETKAAVIVCFQGTMPADIAQIFIDIDCTQVPTEEGALHAGFYRALGKAKAPEKLSMVEKLVHVLSRPEIIHKKIVVTGHSLGGALANVFCQMVDTSIENRIILCMTLGQPRTGDRISQTRFDKTFTGRSLRYVHGADIVPKVFFMQGLRHSKGERFIGTLGKISSDPEDIEAMRSTELSAALPLAILSTILNTNQSCLYYIGRFLMIPLPFLAAHFPSEYERNLGLLIAEDLNPHGIEHVHS